MFSYTQHSEFLFPTIDYHVNLQNFIYICRITWTTQTFLRYFHLRLALGGNGYEKDLKQEWLRAKCSCVHFVQFCSCWINKKKMKFFEIFHNIKCYFLGQVFNFKLGCFVSQQRKGMGMHAAKSRVENSAQGPVL
jgi:hypothetical protein